MSLPFALSDVTEVVAYKQDQITTDLICFEVVTEEAGERLTWLFHEEQPEFGSVEEQLSTLPGFDAGWRESVVFPPFERCATVLYKRDR